MEQSRNEGSLVQGGERKVGEEGGGRRREDEDGAQGRGEGAASWGFAGGAAAKLVVAPRPKREEGAPPRLAVALSLFYLSFLTSFIFSTFQRVQVIDRSTCPGKEIAYNACGARLLMNDAFL